jgi:hypothetical protein
MHYMHPSIGGEDDFFYNSDSDHNLQTLKNTYIFIDDYFRNMSLIVQTGSAYWYIVKSVPQSAAHDLSDAYYSQHYPCLDSGESN